MHSIVEVDLDRRGYPIHIGAGLLSRLDELFAALTSVTNSHLAFIITDSNVGPLYAEQVESALANHFSRVRVITVRAGETSKSVEMANLLWQQMLAFGGDRTSTVVALGGGVVGDLAGFAAATFARGINFFQFPTSLLAQVDSSVGGKVGINLPEGKNLVGAFWQPRMVVIDPQVLQTLDTREFNSGMAEVVKYGVIMDADFFDILENSIEKIKGMDLSTLTDIIARCCRLKAAVVKEDETEISGRRAILNYGHTFGHAIEKVFGFGTYTHGEAIAIGMHCAAVMARQLDRVEDTFVQRQTHLLSAFGLPQSIEELDPPTIEELLVAMRSDKKARDGEIRLVLPDRIGNVELVSSPGDEFIKAAWQCL